MGLLIEKKKSDKSLLIKKQNTYENKPTRYFSDRQEKTVGKITEAQQTISSGNTPFCKGDLLTNDGNWLLECKTKTKSSDSISIKKEWLEKNKAEALFMNRKYNALAFNFGPDEQNYFIIDEFLFQDLMTYLENIERK